MKMGKTPPRPSTLGGANYNGRRGGLSTASPKGTPGGVLNVGIGRRFWEVQNIALKYGICSCGGGS